MDLVQLLKKETETLRIQYLAKSEQWAKNNFDSMLKSDFLFLQQPSGKYFSTRWGKTRAEEARIRNTVNTLNKGLDAYVKNTHDLAELHYESSIHKLAARIQRKNLDLNNLTVVTSHIGVNIETTLTDGVQSVRAFTIIAEGEIQRPHYRYLIK